MDFLLAYSEFITESKEGEALEVFAAARLAGASKIAAAAKEKGGPAMLTYHHFIVKLPYYNKVVKGKFNKEEAEAEYKKLLEELTADKYDPNSISKGCW